MVWSALLPAGSRLFYGSALRKTGSFVSSSALSDRRDLANRGTFQLVEALARVGTVCSSSVGNDMMSIVPQPRVQI